ncbi:MAG: hypothetical protein KDA37_18010 [Planctomycetales bacterium]|nr:hypothetical protein [Planctomycetales bacterium]
MMAPGKLPTLTGPKYPWWSDEEACLEFLYRSKGQGAQCGRCGRNGKFYRVATKRCYACACGRCNVFPMRGTLFQASPLPLSKWFQAVWMMAESGGDLHAATLQRTLGVTYATAWRMKTRLAERVSTVHRPTFLRLLRSCMKSAPSARDGARPRLRIAKKLAT